MVSVIFIMDDAHVWCMKFFLKQGSMKRSKKTNLERISPPWPSALRTRIVKQETKRPVFEIRGRRLLKSNICFRVSKTVNQADMWAPKPKGRFFQKVWCIFLIAQKMCRKLSWKRDFEIVLCLQSADSNCTAVSKGGKIQNTKLRIEHSTIFGQ